MCPHLQCKCDVPFIYIQCHSLGFYISGLTTEFEKPLQIDNASVTDLFPMYVLLRVILTKHLFLPGHLALCTCLKIQSFQPVELVSIYRCPSKIYLTAYINKSRYQDISNTGCTCFHFLYDTNISQKTHLSYCCVFLHTTEMLCSRAHYNLRSKQIRKYINTG